MLPRPATASSMRRVTCSSMVRELAPGTETWTVTIGTLSWGVCSSPRVA